MAPRLIRMGVVAVGALVLLSACAASGGPAPAAGLDTRTTTIGDVEVTITPTQLDSAAAVFSLTLDTHTTALDLDIAANATLTVDGIRWTAATWDGDGADAHHLEGVLRFTGAGPAGGTAQLTITGLDQPLQLTWQITRGTQ